MTIMTHQFKVGDTGKTRDGRRYRVIATDLKSEDTIVAAITLLSGEEYVALRFATGKRFADGTSDADDLMPPTPAVYINVYDDSDGTLWTPEAIHSSRDVADKCASGLRVGCIRVELGARFDG
jgi:hypothetical protein